MFALEVEYLSGRAQATDFRTRNRAEWPPHPSRLFSALVAAWKEGGGAEEGRSALQWLEGLGAPALCASGCSPRDVLPTFVPVNDEIQGIEQRRLRQPRTFPSVTPEKPVVHFIWQQATIATDLRAALSRVAEGVTYLGHSASLVRVAVCEAPPAPTQLPDPTGEIMLRVARPGRLTALEAAYQSGLRPPIGMLHAYADVSKEPTQEPERTVFSDDLIAFRLSGPLLLLEDCLPFLQTVRKAIIGLAAQEADPVPDLLHGHGRHPHVAYLPLPFVEHEHADGHLLGFAAALPRILPSNERRAVLRAFSRLQRVHMGGMRWWEVTTMRADERALALQPAAWTRPHRRWASVTPVVLDRFPKKRVGQTRGEIVAKTCFGIGLPSPLELRIGGYSELRGVPPASAFLPPLRRTGEQRPAFHVTLVFDRPVRGPVLIGAGRYLGMGLLRPLSETSGTDDRSVRLP